MKSKIRRLRQKENKTSYYKNRNICGANLNLLRQLPSKYLFCVLYLPNSFVCIVNKHLVIRLKCRLKILWPTTLFEADEKIDRTLDNMYCSLPTYLFRFAYWEQTNKNPSAHEQHNAQRKYLLIWTLAYTFQLYQIKRLRQQERYNLNITQTFYRNQLEHSDAKSHIYVAGYSNEAKTSIGQLTKERVSTHSARFHNTIHRHVQRQFFKPMDW